MIVQAFSNFWDNASTLAGEVEQPRKTFPKALFSAGLLTCLAYLIPLLAAIGALTLDQEDWVDGYFVDAAEIIVGKWLKVWIEIVAYMSFVDIISSVNFLYSLGMLFEFASFLWLRRKLPTVKRPFIVPMGLPWLGIMCLIPSGFLLYVMAMATKTVYLVAALLTLVGIAWYFLMHFCKSKMWLEFNNVGEKLEDQDLE
uniref:Uncharacterized protein n=1 Tax=Quercus lobata TaxID=97700 RepID=A0A7N2LHF8_QUELO